MTAPGALACTPDFAEDTHVYTFNGQRYPSVTQILGGLGLTPRYPEDRGQREFGKAAHRAVESAAWGRLDRAGTSKVLLPYVDGFCEKADEYKIVPIYTEVRGVHLAEGFAGMVDLFCTIFGGEPAIFDYKTGGVPRAVELQTAGYGELMFAIDRCQPDPLLARKYMPRRFSMQLLPGRAIVKEYRDPYDYVAFIGAVRLFKWQEERRRHE